MQHDTVAAHQQGQSSMPVPGETTVVLLSFEGPDRYSNRGVVGGYVSGLGRAFAAAGFDTTLIYIGDPDAPREEEQQIEGGGTLRLVRWSQWISRYYPGGPYDDEDARVLDYTEGVPSYVAGLAEVVQGNAPPSSPPGLVVIACEWQTSQAMQRLDDDVAPARYPASGSIGMAYGSYSKSRPCRPGSLDASQCDYNCQSLSQA